MTSVRWREPAGARGRLESWLVETRRPTSVASRATDAEPSHPRAQRAGTESEALGGLAWALDDPSALLERAHDVGPFGRLQRPGRRRRLGGGAGPTQGLVDLQRRAGREDERPVDDVL